MSTIIVKDSWVPGRQIHLAYRSGQNCPQHVECLLTSSWLTLDSRGCRRMAKFLVDAATQMDIRARDRKE